MAGASGSWEGKVTSGAGGGASGAGTGGAAGSGGTTARDGGSAAGGAFDAGGIPALARYKLVVAAPANNATLHGTVTVVGKAPGFVNVEVWDATRQNPPLGRAAPATDTTFSISIDTRVLADGPTTWTVHGWDAAPGQSYQQTDTVTLALTIQNENGGSGGATGSGGAIGSGGATGGRIFAIGSENKDGPLSQFETAVQCDVNIMQLTTGWCGDWNNWETSGCGRFAEAKQHIAADTKHVVELSLAPWPHDLSGQSWGACARGDYDSHYTKLAQSMVSNALSDVIIRLGYEWDGSWFPWGTGLHDTGSASSAGPGGTALEYAACFKKFDADIQAVARAAAASFYFRTVMNPIHDAFRAQTSALQQVYDAAGGKRRSGGPIDFMGVDIYDYPSRNDFDASMAAVIAFGRKNGIPLSIPEWGVGGDSRAEPAVDTAGTTFVHKMGGYLSNLDNGFYYASYFNCAQSACAGLHSLVPPNNPNSRAAFVSEFGNGKLGCGADARAMVDGL